MRLFVGLPLPHAVRDRLALLQAGLPGARWVDPDNLHLTLRFLGEVSRPEAEDLDHLLADIRAPAFELMLRGLDTFGNRQKVHTVMIAAVPEPKLLHLAAKVESAAVRAGFPPEGRRFVPHVTLARLKDSPIKRVGAFLAANGDAAVAPFAVECFTLFESRLGSEGAHYERLVDYPLDTGLGDLGLGDLGPGDVGPDDTP